VFHADPIIAGERKNAFSSTSYSNLGEIRNGVRAGVSSLASHRSHAPGNSPTNGSGAFGAGSSAGT
jgi:hypothetical protein